MQDVSPFYREAGMGPGVVCLHSNASSSNQWRGLMDRLAPEFHVLAADGYGAGKSPAWPADRHIALRDEVSLLEPVIARAGDGPLVWIGHSYGAAIALVAAIVLPQRVRALVLYEPTLFALLDAESPPPNAADGIREAVAGAAAALDNGNPSEAARCFIDYWMGESAWARTPDARKGPIQSSMVNVRNWAHALLGEPTPLSAFAALHVPVLYMTGNQSPASSLGVARLLTRTLPQVEVAEFKGLGHMGPVTHPEVVNDRIHRFLTALRPQVTSLP
jgi:pimeloyl-ACP methyl ester carboxylesterase